MSEHDDSLGLLNGIRVVEIGDGIAGSAATALFAELGAQVEDVRVGRGTSESAGPSRRNPDGSTAPYLRLLSDRRKRITEISGGLLDRLPEISANADIVVCDLFDDELEEALDDIDEYERRISEVNRSAWVTISPFGLTGPYRGFRGSELVCSAAGGMLSSIRAEETGQPIKLGGTQALLSAGQFAALAGLHGLDLARRARPAHLEVSAQESVLVTGPGTHCSLELLNSGGAGGPARAGPPSGLYPCMDGFVYINVLEDHQWQSTIKAMEFGDWADGLTALERRERASEIDPLVKAWTGVRKKAECADELQRYGVPAAPVNSPTDMLQASQFVFREFFRTLEIDDTRTVATRLPFQLEVGNRNGQSRKPSMTGIQGLRVLELTHVIAAPIAGSLLGAMGADVVRVENRQRLDVYRRTPPYADDFPGLNRNCYFIMNNHSKRILELENDPSGDELDSLVKRSDVVLENWGRRAARVGADARSLAKNYDHVLAISSSGFGSNGPIGDFRAYAYNVQAFGGLADLTRDQDRSFVKMRTAWADLCTGAMLATVIAAWALGPERGRSMAIDLSMAEVVASRLAEFITAAAVNEGSVLLGNEIYPLAPNNVYTVSDGDEWIALTVKNDREWFALNKALGNPPSLQGDAYSSQVGRWDHRDEIDRVLWERLVGENGRALVGRLQDLKVRSSLVWSPETLIEETQLVGRGFFVRYEHPELGICRNVGLPWKIVGEDRIPITFPLPPLEAREPRS